MQKGILNGFTADYFYDKVIVLSITKNKERHAFSSENVRKKYMNLFKKIVALGFFALLFSSVQAQSLSSEEKDILQLQDQRSLGGGRLAGYLSSTDENLRYRALIAFANIQEDSSARVIIPLLADRVPRVRAAAALALGYLSDSLAAQKLLAVLQKEKDRETQKTYLDALGRCGDMMMLDSLTINNMPEYAQEGLALSFARFALRGIKSERLVWSCFNMLSDTSAAVRSTALYTLWHAAPYGLIGLEIIKQNDLLLQIAGDPNPIVRMNLATLLGRTRAENGKAILDSLESTENKLHDWRVLVQIEKTRTIIQFSRGQALEKIVPYLRFSNDHCIIAMLENLMVISADTLQHSSTYAEIGKELQRIIGLKGVASDAVRGEALVVLGLHYPDFIDDYDFILQDPASSIFIKKKYIEASAARFTKKHLDLLLGLLNDKSIPLSMTAWDYVRQFLTMKAFVAIGIDSTAIQNLIPVILEKAGQSLRRNDIGIATVVANLFSQPSAGWILSTDERKQKMIKNFADVSNTFDSPDDIETQIAIIDAVGQIGWEKSVPFLQEMIGSRLLPVAKEARRVVEKITQKVSTIVPLPQEVEKKSRRDWSELESIKSDQRVELLTSKGRIVLRLKKEDAPFTVLSFVRLVKKGFFNGLYFHRVVPNFVVQTGDPRGDGWGGPGYTLRTEISFARFEEGSCGMASAGKDTEGSQFFVTYWPAIHLDGTYTVFAKAIEGLDVASRIQIGDTILSARLMD
jgi:peptidylprolyl isomerase